MDEDQTEDDAPVPPQESLVVKYFGGFKAMYTNNVCFYVVLGACFRFW